jgi:hypothetical protein
VEPSPNFAWIYLKFAQMIDVFVCDLVVAIKVCQGDVHGMYCDSTFKFIVSNSQAFKIIVEV